MNTVTSDMTTVDTCTIASRVKLRIVEVTRAAKCNKIVVIMTFLHTQFDFSTCTLVHTQITHARLQIQTHLLEKILCILYFDTYLTEVYFFRTIWKYMISPRNDENTNHWCTNALNLSLKTTFSFVSYRNTLISAFLFISSKYWFR